jgi:hypothetical protein
MPAGCHVDVHLGTNITTMYMWTTLPVDGYTLHAIRTEQDVSIIHLPCRDMTVVIDHL